MRNLMRFCASDHLRKRMFQDAEKFVRHFDFRPEIGLQALHPLEVGNDHAARVTQNVRDHKDFVPPFFKNQVGLGCCRAIGRFGEDAAFELSSVLSVDYAIDCGTAPERRTAW